MIATSIEQSKRLIAASLDPGSADMCYANVEFNPNYLPDIRLSGIPYAKCVETYKAVGLIAEDIIPAWSLAALWDIVHNLDKTYDFDTKMKSDELMELLVKTIEFKFKKNKLWKKTNH